MGDAAIVITDAEKNEAINRMVRDLRAWRVRNPDAPLGIGPRDPRLDAPEAR